MNLIEVSSASEGEMPFAKNSAYKFHSQKKHPRLLYKVGGKLFFDVEEWERMAKDAQAKQVEISKRIRRGNTK